nr:EOG090X036X [Sida crystallina]
MPSSHWMAPARSCEPVSASSAEDQWPILKRILTGQRYETAASHSPSSTSSLSACSSSSTTCYSSPPPPHYATPAVRFGRVPKREKAKILAAMQSVNARLAERSLPAEFCDESQLMSAVVRAHMETCDFIRDKVRNQMADAQRQPDYTVATLSAHLRLLPPNRKSIQQQQLVQDFSERFVPAIRDVVEFAKRLPGFSLLCEDDKVTLLKPGVFEVLLVRLAAMFDSQSNMMLCLNGQLLRRDALHNSSNARFLMDSMFEFANGLNSLGLNDAELGLFCAVVVVAADRPGLKNVELVERMQSKLRTVLETVLSQTHQERPGLVMELLHKIPDLRTLNTLHSEKLLAFKMTEQQQQQQHQPSMHHNAGHYSLGAGHQPPSSPWHDSYDEESAKSPMGSVSSSESVCSAEVGMSDLPLLAAVAGSATPLVAISRRRSRDPSQSENGSVSSDGEENDRDSSVAMMMESSPPRSCPYKGRKLESPDDSGIESGVDRYEKLSTASRSTNTSLCSSPRSSLEDKVKEVDDVSMGSASSAVSCPRGVSASSNGPAASSVDDMPVLKRVLQAPPLFDTNSLMDEAYKPHKKFRALTLQRKGCEESSTPVAVPVVTSVSRSASSSQQTASVTSSPSVLSAALSSPPNSSSSYSALCSALTCSTASSLTSTHSTLARSLMEGPKLINSEHQRRADLIVANIMKGTTASSSTSSSPSPTPSSSSYSSQSYGSPYSPQKTVLTSGPLYNGQSSSASSSPSAWMSHSPQYHTQRPSHSRLVYEPAASHHRGSPLASSAHSPRSATGPAATVAAAVPSSAGSQVELQVGIASDSQPLNLSLKSPSSSPARSTTPVTHAHYFPLHA